LNPRGVRSFLVGKIVNSVGFHYLLDSWPIESHVETKLNYVQKRDLIGREKERSHSSSVLILTDLSSSNPHFQKIGGTLGWGRKESPDPWRESIKIKSRANQTSIMAWASCKPEIKL